MIIILSWVLSSRDKDGYYWLTGRVDDVINVRFVSVSHLCFYGMHKPYSYNNLYISVVQNLISEGSFWVCVLFFCSGHRIGTAEVESALVSHPQCAEAAVVGIEHEVGLLVLVC